MMLFYQDNHIKIYNKDCRQMTELPDESVQCVVTSPPYFGLRKYSGDQELIWGGDENCEHQWGRDNIVKKGHPGNKSTLVGPSTATIAKQAVNKGSFCSLCGAWRGSLGLEPTIELYLLHLIEILREIKRVLRKDGVLFLNIGDSYMSSPSNQQGHGIGKSRAGARGAFENIGRQKRIPSGNLKPLDLCLIPFRLALAAQEMGWWVRSVIIWNKNNPMPSSVNGFRWERHRVKVGSRGRQQAAQKGHHFQDHSGDNVISDTIWEDCPGCPKCKANDGYVLRKGSWRPTESHEYIIMMTKTATYYCDAEAVRELSTERPSGNKERKYRRDYGGPEAHTGCQGFSIPYEPNGMGRNLRSVWTFPTVPFPKMKIGGKFLDHFAVFPQKLPELCIKAATPEVGCCAKCGAPWSRVLEKKASQFNIRVRDAKAGRATPEEGYKATEEEIEWYPGNHPDPGYSKTIGWRPTCKCNAEKVPSLVLDPMAGAGTTLWVAKKLNRFACGYELSQDYCQLAVERCRQQVGL